MSQAASDRTRDDGACNLFEVGLSIAHCRKLRIYLVLANLNTDVRAIAIIISSIRYMKATSVRVLLISLVIFRISKLCKYT